MDYLSIKGGKLILEPSDGSAPVEIKSMEQLPGEFLVSSSVDFPEEWSSDPEVIKLCKEIRA